MTNIVVIRTGNLLAQAPGGSFRLGRNLRVFRRVEEIIRRRWDAISASAPVCGQVMARLFAAWEPRDAGFVVRV